jgi:hypothetical protein
VGSTRARVAGDEASPRVPRTRDACGRVASRAARTSARDRHAISSVGSSRRLPREKATFLRESDAPSPSGPTGVERSHARVFRTDMFCVWARFFGASSAVHESQTVEYPFFATCAREKIEAPTPSIAARSPRVDRLMNAARVTGLATSNVRLRRAAIIRDTASPNEQQNPRPRAMSSTWAQ